ncbi:MAG TPA: calcium-translocating P-type ATPase, PMCA-type [Cyclobacteriaceae bacterium]|jgi:Ca2+-transporting ATPase|nr:calcium-translocating P-type ATPase, PMCA-type [Cytophagales bacterium]HRE67894.1 calcium-translocating P-type ATPase, PMCA-type [Cyclobacteriaceae bacterium]HRF32070.1 calcium-translocating P-type ATPase, PMCA-type [Cyclobacteriaceae bacterium]
MNWYQKSITETLALLTSSTQGLSNSDAQQRLTQFGKNEIQAKDKKTAWGILFAQFKELMILILLAAAALSYFIGDSKDAIIILVIVVLNAAIGFFQEYKAEKALDELKKLAASNARIIRQGEIKIIPAHELVPGDIVHLEAGDSVPADLRLIEVHSIKIEEASLTGESYPVLKTIESLTSETVPIGDQTNMAFKSTTVSYGRATGVVVSTGMQTEIGKIASLLEVADSETPLQKRMAGFSKKLSIVILFVSLIIYGAGLMRGEDQMQMLMTAISVAVAAIPEALPAVITVALALGARRMVRKQALIRKLPAVETLGSVNYICTDKTGTLTENKMTVRETWIADNTLQLDKFSAKEILWLSMSLNHDTTQNDKVLLGDPTEVAAVVYAHTQQPELKDASTQYNRVEEIPFDSDRKMMTTVHQFGAQLLVITKGAVESILPQCNQADFNTILLKADAIAENGMRTLAYGYKLINTNQLSNTASLEKDLTFIGLIGMIDPPRAEVLEAVKECKRAGITPVMITGDHPKTAVAIARELGILSEGEEVVTGTELSQMSPEELAQKVNRTRVYARVSAEQKLTIVKSLQAQGNFVAMTGDGVNDAPSLKMANIGIAMGITGTDVSKQASDMILLDDNFTTIVKAVREGRRIFDNIRKFIKYIMTGNAGEIWTIFLAPLVGLPMPLLPIHILWINLVSDGLPSIALAYEPAESDIMKRPPQKPNINIFSEGVGIHILWVGFSIGLICVIIQYFSIHYRITNWQTLVFTTLSLCQLAHVIAVRSAHNFIYKHGLFRNPVLTATVLLTVGLQLALIYVPWLQGIFKTAPLSMLELLACVGAAALVFHLVELEKWFRFRSKAFAL